MPLYVYKIIPLFQTFYVCCFREPDLTLTCHRHFAWNLPRVTPKWQNQSSIPHSLPLHILPLYIPSLVVSIYQSAATWWLKSHSTYALCDPVKGFPPLPLQYTLSSSPGLAQDLLYMAMYCKFDNSYVHTSQNLLMILVLNVFMNLSRLWIQGSKWFYKWIITCYS